MIFGTHNPIRVLSPSLRALPFSGIEFSFQMKEAGYNEDGIIWNDDWSDGEGDEENPKQEEEIQMSTIRTE